MNKIIKEDLEVITSCQSVDWTKFKDSTVLITGANGMLPAYLVFTLLFLNKKYDYNTKVIALVRNEDKAKTKFKDFLDDEHLSIFVHDVTDNFDIDGPVDYIIHAASQASPKYYGVDPVGTIDANIIGTTNVLKLAKDKQSKSLLYISSGEVYGKIEGAKPNVEDEYGFIDPLCVRSCYGQSKRMGETLCVCWNYQFNTHAKIVRPFHSFGPGMLLNDGRVFADFVSNILKNENIVLKSDGSAVRAFCYISDATIGFFKVLLDGVDGEAYNIGNDKNAASIKDLATMLVDIYSERGPKLIFDIDENDLRTGKMKSPLSVSIPNMEKTYSLGFEPAISVKDGFIRTIESFYGN